MTIARKLFDVQSFKDIAEFIKLAQFSIFPHFWAISNFSPDYILLRRHLKLCLLIDYFSIITFWASFGHRWFTNLRRWFAVFVNSEKYLVKNAKLWTQFSPRQEEIFNFWSRFSESLNNELLAVLQAFWMIFTPSMRKIKLKLTRFAFFSEKITVNLLLS